jgi:hypothetical protein
LLWVPIPARVARIDLILRARDARRCPKKSRGLAVERYRDCDWREATTVTDEETDVVDEIRRSRANCPVGRNADAAE